MKRHLRWLAALILCPVAANAASTDSIFAKLEPEERAHQACVVLGLSKIRKDHKFRHADRLKTGVLGRATYSGTRVTTVGGAVRSDHKWYKLTFDCTVTKDQMKATAFSYEIGKEIPRERWDDIGLWD